MSVHVLWVCPSNKIIQKIGISVAVKEGENVYKEKQNAQALTRGGGYCNLLYPPPQKMDKCTASVHMQVNAIQVNE